jgi:hypothetical protein
MAKYVFGTGKIRYGAVGATLTDSDNIAAVQNVTFQHDFQTAEVREANWINVYPVANKQYDASAKLGFSMNDLAQALIPYITGAVASSAGGYDIYTAGATAEPAEMKLEFHGKTTAGKNVIIRFFVAKIFSLPLNFERTAFLGPTLEAIMYGDSTRGFWEMRIEQ